MSYLVNLYDGNYNIINSVTFIKSEFFKPSEKILEVSELELKEIINYMDYSVNVFIPFNDGEDFIIQNLSDVFKNFFDDEEEFHNSIGKSFKKSFPILVELGLFDILVDVFRTNNVGEYKLTIYENNELIYSFDYNFVKSNDRIFFLAKNITDFEVIYQQERETFYNSPQAILIIQDNKIVRANHSYLRIFKKSKEELIGKPYTFNNFNLYDVNYVNWKKVFFKLLNKEIYYYDCIKRFKINSNEYKYFEINAVPITYKNRLAVQISAIDITKRREAEFKAIKFQNSLAIVQSISKIAIMYWDPLNKFQWTDEIYNILGETDYNLDDSNLSLFDYFLLSEEADFIRGKVEECFKEVSSFDKLVQIQTSNGLKHIFIYCQSFLAPETNEINLVGYIQDFTENINQNQKLELILDDLNRSNEDKAVLLKEVHHRVKNNLQIILSLLNLDLRYHPENPLATVESTRNRINSMALIHEKIYGSKDLAHINLKDYICSEVDSLVNLYSNNNINIHYDLDDSIELDVDKSIPLGLILNEVFTNTVKYAFPNDEEGQIDIIFKYLNENKKKVSLILADNGVGLPEDFDVDKSSSLGLSIIQNLVNQLEGNLSLLDQPGTVYKIEFEL